MGPAGEDVTVKEDAFDRDFFFSLGGGGMLLGLKDNWVPQMQMLGRGVARRQFSRPDPPAGSGVVAPLLAAAPGPGFWDD
jgi:hypothetical protein